MIHKFNMDAWVKDFVEQAKSNRRLLSGTTRYDSRTRLDAGETMALARELEALLSETFDYKLPELKLMRLLPVQGKAPAGAETMTYKQFQHFGEAKIVERFSDDLPLANGQATSDTRRVVSIGAGFEISFQDLRAAAMSNIPLESQFSLAARRMIEEKMHRYACYGDVEVAGSAVTSAYGFLNMDNATHSYLTPVSPLNGSWASADPQDIIQDIAYLWASIQDTTEDVHHPDTLLIPASLWGYVSQPRESTDLSVKSWCLANLDGLTTMESWGELDTADAAGTGPRMVAFENNAMNGWIEMPMDITFHPPQEKNLSYVVPAECRFAGYVSPYPLAVAYMDGL